MSGVEDRGKESHWGTGVGKGNPVGYRNGERKPSWVQDRGS